MGKAWRSALIAIVLAFSQPCAAQIVDTICSGSRGKEYYVTPTPGSLYFWQVENAGTVTKNENHKITVDWADTIGTFYLSVVEQNNLGCFGDTIYAQIVILPSINLNITGPSEVCEGEIVNLTASGAHSYEWNTGHTQSNLVTSVRRTTTYYVTSTQGSCGSGTASHTVFVNPKPVALIKHYPEKPRLGERVFFESAGPGSAINLWTINPAGHNSSERTFYHRMSDTGTYHVKLIAINDFGCSDTTEGWIYIKDSMRVFVPNAFSPNGDSHNDVFEVKGINIAQMTVQIYSRFGGLLKEFNGLTEGWDGTKNGQLVQEGVYMVIVEAMGESGERFVYKGNVTLLR